MSEYKEHRKFVHDISNMLAIAQGSLRRAKKLEDKDDAKDFGQEITECYELSEKYITECIGKLKEYRVFIHQKESESKSW